MDQEQLVALLAREQGYLSGEEMSHALGVTRAAVWKEINVLRQEGWPIVSSTRLGYRLDGPPPVLSAPYLEAMVGHDSLCASKILVEPQVDSTNTRLKALAAQGAPEGTVLAALEQTGGRGTRGRTFSSPPGGVYLSLLLRPRVSLSQLFQLTGWVAVAVRRAIVQACGAPAQIKWLNDIYLNGRKLCGILTELSLLGESGEPDYVVVGVGVNLSHTAQTFRDLGLEGIATSLALEGYSPNPNTVALALIHCLEELARDFPQDHASYLEEYRSHCLTLGKPVSFPGPSGVSLTGTAQAVDEDFALVVQDTEGRDHQITSGSVTLL